MMDKKKMVSEKISKLIHEGKKPSQAIAMALSMARGMKKK